MAEALTAGAPARETVSTPAVAAPPTIAARRLPRGRHNLSREEVAAAQRLRILHATVEIMSRKGFTATSVADILQSAGVSRETFYQQFASKLDCFLAAFDAATSLLLASMDSALRTKGSAEEKASAALAVYLETLANHPLHARLFLIEVFAAGPVAFERRIAVQRQVVDVFCKLLGEEERPDNRFAAEMLVAGVASMVTNFLMAGDHAELTGLHDRVMTVIPRIVSRSRAA